MKKNILESLELAKERSRSLGRFAHVRLNHGATLTDFVILEAVIGRSIPADIKALLSVHNGEDGPLGLLGAQVYLMSSIEIARYVSELRQFLYQRPGAADENKSIDLIPILTLVDEIALLECSDEISAGGGRIVLFDPISGNKRSGFSDLSQLFNELI